MKKFNHLEQFGLEADEMAKTLSRLVALLGRARIEAAKGNAEAALADMMILRDALGNAEGEAQRLRAWAVEAVKAARGIMK